MRNIHQAVLVVDRRSAGMLAMCTVEIRKPSGWTTQALLRPREGAGEQRVLAGVGESPRFPGQNLKLLWMKVPYRST
ncbi:hypothetical protein FHR88_006969 [Bradyrhizobium betae]|nr:hypothetical protein [Bradyrhizobium betae]